MRISDWSSDVCSSDLSHALPAAGSDIDHGVSGLLDAREELHEHIGIRCGLSRFGIARVKMEDGRARFRRFDRRGSDLIRSHWQVRPHGRRVDGTCPGEAENDIAHGNSWYVRLFKGSGVTGVPRKNSDKNRK